MGDSAGHLSGEPLRVLMTTDAVGGVWQYSIDLSAGLAERGVQVTLVTLGPRPSNEQRKQAHQVPDLTLIESDFALEWMSDPWADVDASGVWLIELASAVQPHVVHLNGYSHAALDWKQPVVAIAHSCVYSWWRAVHQCVPGADWLEYQRRVASGLQHADAIVAPSRWMAAELEHDYGLARGRAEIIHNFSRTQFEVREKQPIILAVGRRWDKAKNIAMLDAIAPELHGEIRMAGSSTTGGAALSHSELMEQMDSAAIFAHPALYEPFGLAILEAARARCCLVLSDIPSLRELWDGAAIFVDPRNESAWIRELNSLVRDPARTQTFADRAHEHAAQYDAGTSIGQYLRLYHSLLASARRSGKDVAA